MANKKFPAEDLTELAWEGEVDGYEYVTTYFNSKSRWFSHHTLVFKHGGKLWGANFMRGLTEQQEVEPFENATDKDGNVPCFEMRAVERTITVYEPVPEGDSTSGA